jgi:hypothetical protein
MSRLAAHGIGQVFRSIGDRQARMIITIMVVFCCILTWFLTGLASVPQFPGLSPSLLLQSNPVLSMAAVGVSLIVCLFLSYRLASYSHRETGIFVAVVSLIVVAGRAGPMRYVLFTNPQPGIFIELAFELVLLYAWVTVAWLLLNKLLPAKPTTDSLANGISAMIVQAVVTGACILPLAMSDQPAQAIMAVGVGALVGSLISYMSFPLEHDIWFWMGPLLTGVFGYLMAWHDPAGIQVGLIGFPRGPMLGALARPIPLAYASAGPAGALLGLWTARSWHHGESPESKKDA